MENKLTEKQKSVLKEMVDFTCEICNKKFKPEQLEIHRIQPGYKGGKYIPRNCEILCNKCHKRLAEQW